MHSSTGLAISAEQMLCMAPPEVIRWLVMQPQPNRHIDFDPGLGLLNSVDKYDRMVIDYYDGKLEENSRRAIEFSYIKEKPEEKPTPLPYRHLVTLAQSKNSTGQIIEALKRTGDIGNLDEGAIQNLDERIECINGWLDKYAPESVKFLIQKEAPTIDFDEEELQRIKHLKGKMSEIEWKPDNIHDAFYDLQEKNQVPAKDYFKIMYNVILGKDKGPRLGFFLATMERKFVLDRLSAY